MVRSLIVALVFSIGFIGYYNYDTFTRYVHYELWGSINVDGATIFLDPKDLAGTPYLLAVQRNTGEDVALRTFIKPGDTVIDVGADIGWFTVLAAQLVGERGKVIAFEPDPETFAILQRNVAVNGFKNVVLEQKALSNKHDRLKLFLAQENRGDNRIFDFGDKRQSVEVEALSFDEYARSLNPPLKVDFVKIDTQGAEGVIIEGMKETFQRFPELKVDIEFCPAFLTKSGYEPAKLLQTFEQWGFEFWNIDSFALPFRPATSAQLLSELTPQNGRQVNLLLRRPACHRAES